MRVRLFSGLRIILNERSKHPLQIGGDLLTTGIFLETENRYVCDKYDTEHRLLPAQGDPRRYQVLQWVHAAEGMFALHGIAILYARWFQKTGDVEDTEANMSVTVVKDLDYLEAELGKNAGKFLLGDEVTAADTMMQFSAQFILERKLGTKGKSWPKIEQWLKECGDRPAYEQAVKKTGHEL